MIQHYTSPWRSSHGCDAHSWLSILCLLLAALTSPPATAATVDRQPAFDTGTDTGLFVWRTWGGDWQVRVLAASGSQQVDGTFETSQQITSTRRLSLEADDTVAVNNGTTLRFALNTARRTIDGVLFSAGTGDVCLRTSSAIPIYLGSNATPATSPVDLTSSGACGTQSAKPPAQSNLLIHRSSRFDWQVTLDASQAAESFDGRFEFSKPLVSYQPVSIESADLLSQPDPGTLDVHMEVWPGWYDGVDFTMEEFTRVCLRSTAGREQVVSLLSPGQQQPLRVTTPVDLTNNGACGLPADPFPPPTHGRKFNAGHYVVLTRHDDDASLAASVIPGVKGFVKRFSWRELEPTPGNYDFSGIAADLATVAGYGLQFIVLIEDKTFSKQVPTPDYLAGKTVPNIPGGYSVVRWDPYVVKRYKALVTALGNRFDSNANFEGIATAELAHGLDEAQMAATGYTAEKYRDVIIDELIHAANSLPKSRVFWFMNFLWDGNHYMGDIARRVAPHGVVMGGPDVLPDNVALQRHPYPFYDGAVGNMPLFAQVEPSCYHHPHADTSYPTTYWTPPELFSFARDELHVSYMFWVRWRWRLYLDSYNWWDAIPVIESNPTFNR